MNSDCKNDSIRLYWRKFGTKSDITICVQGTDGHTLNLQRVRKEYILCCCLQWCAFNFCVPVILLPTNYIITHIICNHPVELYPIALSSMNV
jgi:hypothetical protein